MQRQPITQTKNNRTTIDIDAIRPSERFNFWSDVICKHFSPSVNHTDRPVDSFRARMSMRPLGAIGLSTVGSTPMVSVRDRQSLRRDPLDCFFVSRLDYGHAVIRQGGREAVQRAGDFVMYDSATPFEYVNFEDYSGTWIRLPRQIVTNRMANAEAMTARTLSGTAAMGRIVSSVVGEAHDIDLCGNEPAANRLATSIVDLLSAAFEMQAGLDPDANARHMVLLDKAKAYILANLEDPELDTETLVQALGVSNRTLNRLFAQDGTTPIRWVWKQRLERARELLVSGREDRVADVALSCGFSNFSHFTRVFKSEFGATPTDYMAHIH